MVSTCVGESAPVDMAGESMSEIMWMCLSIESNKNVYSNCESQSQGIWISMANY